MTTIPCPRVHHSGARTPNPKALPSVALVGLTIALSAALSKAADLPVRSSPDALEAGASDPTGELTLRTALGLALARSPALQSFSWEIRARDARLLQAGRLPNPQLHTEIENVGGSGSRQAFEDTETTVRLSQLIELGGKRGKRQRLAELGTTLATWDYEAKRLHVLSETSKAFIQVLGAQERVDLARELARLADEAVHAVDSRVAAGGASPVESTRAKVSLAKAELEKSRTEQELVAARSALAASWGSTRPTFTRVVGDLTRVGPPPSEEELFRRLEANPDLARWETELDERRAALSLEQAGRVPDVTVGAGGRHFSDNGDNALVLELSVPLPVFNRNDGAIAEAEHRLSKARADRSAAYVAAHAALSTAAARLAAAYDQARRLRTHVLPQAKSSLDGALDAYRKGLFRSVDVLDAQRTLFELRGDYLASLESYHLLGADVERLTATPLTDDETDGGAR
jgi:cobalt-zinc-cadmium efflux system outer membrane protein